MQISTWENSIYLRIEFEFKKFKSIVLILSIRIRNTNLFDYKLEIYKKVCS